MQLEPGQQTRIEFTVPTDLASFTGRSGRRIVEPGELVLGVGRSSADIVSRHHVQVTGPVREVDHRRRLRPIITLH